MCSLLGQSVLSSKPHGPQMMVCVCMYNIRMFDCDVIRYQPRSKGSSSEGDSTNTQGAAAAAAAGDTKNAEDMASRRAQTAARRRSKRRAKQREEFLQKLKDEGRCVCSLFFFFLRSSLTRVQNVPKQHALPFDCVMSCVSLPKPTPTCAELQIQRRFSA